MPYALPEATREIVALHEKGCQNLGLVLDKFVPSEVIDDREKKGHKQRWLTDLAERFAKMVNIQDSQLVLLWGDRYQRWVRLVDAAEAQKFTMAPNWRMVVGLGGRTVLETDLTLDQLSGLPFIPGSALKGLARTYAVQEGFHSSSQKPESDPPDVRRIFGTQADERNHVQESAGTVIFFDALPLPTQEQRRNLYFSVDIMNPHYPDYYRNSATAPTNDQDPIPVYFLTVTRATFHFAVAPRLRGGSADAVQARKDAEQTKMWLEEALQSYGVGAKTAADYGFLHPVEAPAPPREPSMTEEEVWKWLGHRRAVTGTVEAQSQAGAILKLDDPAAQLDQRIPRGLLAGQSRPVDGRPLTCRVMGVQPEQGEWFVKLSPQ